MTALSLSLLRKRAHDKRDIVPWLIPTRGLYDNASCGLIQRYVVQVHLERNADKPVSRYLPE